MSDDVDKLDKVEDSKEGLIKNDEVTKAENGIFAPSPPQKFELKELPSSLKYAFIDKDENLPVIIAA